MAESLFMIDDEYDDVTVESVPGNPQAKILHFSKDSTSGKVVKSVSVSFIGPSRVGDLNNSEFSASAEVASGGFLLRRRRIVNPGIEIPFPE